MHWQKILALIAPLTLVAVIFCASLGTQVAPANSSESAAMLNGVGGGKRSLATRQFTLARGARIGNAGSACPAGYRALNMTNHCSYDVWFAEDPSAAPGGTPQCPDPTNSKNDNFGCPAGTTCNNAGVCVTSCNDPGTVNAPDCGPNQTCVDGGFQQKALPSATPTAIYECFANYYEPTPISTPTPASGSGWDLAANGGQSVICIPEAAPTSGAAPNASCTQNSDCQSYACISKNADPSIPNLSGNFCLPNETGCVCANTITWSGNFWGRTGCTLSNGQLNCSTGGCGTDIECTTGPPPPATLTEMTLLAPSDPDNQDSYDVSMVSGFNVGYSMQPVPGTYSGQCGYPGVGCSFDINANCPTELQFLDSNNNVVGCYTPNKACSQSSPPAALNCTAAVPFLCSSAADCPYGHQNPAQQTMTCNQGQCVCTQDTDCPQGFSCSGGSCTQTSGPSATWNDLYGCQNFYNLSPLNANIYPSWLTGTDEETGITCGCPSWSSGCLAHNYNWETAPISDTNSHTVEDYYQIFHNGCPTAYSYAYDDGAGIAGCQPTAGATVGVSYNIDFCPSGSGSPTATPTASPTTSATASATPTATATPTLTATATPTITATPTVTVTASPTPSAQPTLEWLYTNPAGTVAFPATQVGQTNQQTLNVINPNQVGFTFATQKKGGNVKAFKVSGGSCVTSGVGGNSQCNYLLTYAPSPKHAGQGENTTLLITAKPDIQANPQTLSVILAGYAEPTPTAAPTQALSTTPEGTLAFGDVVVGEKLKETLTVTNPNPTISFRLSYEKINGNKKDFLVSGGSCETSRKVKGNSSCTYLLTFKPSKKHIYEGESVAFVITATPANGNAQVLVVTLAGYALPGSVSMDDERILQMLGSGGIREARDAAFRRGGIESMLGQGDERVLRRMSLTTGARARPHVMG